MIYMTTDCEFLIGEKRIVLPQGAAVEIWNRRLDRVAPSIEDEAIERLNAGKASGRELLALFVLGEVVIVTRRWITSTAPEQPRQPYCQRRSQRELEELARVKFEVSKPKPKAQQLSLF